MGRLKTAIRAAILASGALLIAGAARAQDKVKVRFGILTTASQAAFYVGVKQGIYAKYGFDVEVMPLATGVQANQALAAGQVDWSGGGVESTVVSWATGLPFKAYAMYAKGGDSYGILVRKEANIASAKDLKGKKVAVPQGTAPAQGLEPDHPGCRPAARRGRPGQRQLRQHGPDADLRRGRCDGGPRALPDARPRRRWRAEGVLLLRMGKYVQGGGLFLITDKWAAANPGQDGRRRRRALGVAAVGSQEPEGSRRHRGGVPQGRAAHRRGLVQGARPTIR